MRNMDRPHKLSIPPFRYIYVLLLILLTSVALLIIPRIASHSLAALSVGSSEHGPNTLLVSTTPTTSKEDAHQMLKVSLVILQGLLKDIQVQVHSQGENIPMQVGGLDERLLRRDLASTFQGIFGGIAGSLTNGISGVSRYIGLGIGNGTLQALEVNRAFLKPNPSLKATGLNAAAESFGEGLAISLVGSLNLKALLPSISALRPATLALSQGLGSGAAAGLNLKALNTTAFNATGINGIVGTFGQGLTSSFLGGFDVKKLLTSVGFLMSGPAANQIALSLAQGFGGGASSALNLTSASESSFFNTMGPSGLAGNVGQGLSTSFLRDMNIQALIGSVGANFTNAQKNEAALSLAQGLGSGAAFALKLSTKPLDNTTFGTDSISGIAGNVGQGLSTTFLQNVNLSRTLSKTTEKFSGANLLSVAQGLGSGLGEGTVVGLGLQPASQSIASDGTTPDNTALAQVFAKGLSEKFFYNGTLSKLTQMLTGDQSAKLNLAKVSTGLGIGLIDGAQQSVENAGGFVGILSMQAKDAVGMMAMPLSSNFDDGVGGVATGLGSGLGFEVTKALLQVLGKPSLVENSSSTSKMAASEESLNMLPAQKNARSFLMYEQKASVPAKLDTLMLAKTLNPVLQTGSNTLGCQGIGGLASVLHALRGSKALSGGKLENLTMALGSFSNQTFTVEDGAGNTITINVALNMITVNGNKLSKLFSLTAAHITSSVLAWIIGIPIIMMLSSFRNFAIMTGRSNYLLTAPRWQVIIGTTVVLPSVFITLVVGIIGEGKRAHFRSAHGILSLLLVAFTLLAMAIFTLRNNSPCLSLAHTLNLTLVIILTIATILTGFVDLSTITLCIFQWVPQAAFATAGLFISIPLFSAITLALLERGLQRLVLTRDLVRLSEVENRIVIDDKGSFIDRGSFIGNESLVSKKDWEDMYAQLVTITKFSPGTPERESSIFRIPRGVSLTASVGKAF